MSAIETIGIQATAPGAGGAGAAFSGNSLTIRDNPKSAYIIDCWQRRQAAGFTRLVSPLMHDTTVGMTWRGPVQIARGPRGWNQPVYAQDTLTATLSGSATAGDIEQSFVTVFYDDLPGVAGRFISASELEKRAEAIYGFSATLALGTAGGWSGEETIIAEQDQLKANRDYAWIGLTGSVGAGAYRMLGVDTGNLGIAMPAEGDLVGNGLDLSNYWPSLSTFLGNWPVIPVINSSNKSLTNQTGATDENGVDSVAVVLFALLSKVSKK